MKRWLVLVVLISSFFLLYQHSTGLSWDFMVYASGARWFTGNGIYLEFTRPPMASMIIASLGADIISEYLFVFAANMLVISGALLVARRFKVNPVMLVALAVLTPIYLSTATSVGTEALSMGLFLFALYLFPSPLSGLFIGTMFMSRYTTVALIPIFLFAVKPELKLNYLKKLFIVGIVFLITLSPWLIFNYIEAGDPLFSITDSFTHNVLARGYINDPPQLEHFGYYINILAPLFAAGVFYMLRKPKWSDLFFILLFGLVTVSYIRTPVKIFRYLFFLILPVAYFSTRALAKVPRLRRTVFLLFVVMNLSIAVAFFSTLEPLQQFIPAYDYISSRNCLAFSSTWPHFNYLGHVTVPMPSEELVEQFYNNGALLVVSRGTTEPEYATNEDFITSHNILYEDDSFWVFGRDDICMEPRSELKLAYTWISQGIY
jgi:hypothetical protein